MRLRRSEGVTAQFKPQLLHRINRELQRNFQSEALSSQAFYDPIMSRIGDAPESRVLAIRARRQVRGSVLRRVKPSTPKFSSSTRSPNSRTGQARGIHAGKSLDRSGAAVQRARDGAA